MIGSFALWHSANSEAETVSTHRGIDVESLNALTHDFWCGGFVLRGVPWTGPDDLLAAVADSDVFAAIV